MNALKLLNVRKKRFPAFIFIYLPIVLLILMIVFFSRTDGRFFGVRPAFGIEPEIESQIQPPSKQGILPKIEQPPVVAIPPSLPSEEEPPLFDISTKPGPGRNQLIGGFPYDIMIVSMVFGMTYFFVQTRKIK